MAGPRGDDSHGHRSATDSVLHEVGEKYPCWVRSPVTTSSHDEGPGSLSRGPAYNVREGGVEPPRPFGHTDLNRARLPIPPLARAAEETLAHGRPPTQNDGTPPALTLVVTGSWEDRNHAECGKWQIP